METKITVLDAGHGGYDSGALSTKGYKESDFNLSMVNLVKNELKSYLTVYLTRQSDTFISLSDRKNLTCVPAGVTPELFISFHANSCDNPSVTGVETFHYPNSVKGKQLATLIQSEVYCTMNGISKTNNRGVKEATYTVLTCKPVAVLIEYGFLSNVTEASVLQNKANQLLLAKATARAILKYLNIPEITQPSPKPLPIPEPSVPSQSATPARLYSKSLLVTDTAPCTPISIIKTFKVNDKITAINEDKDYWILDVNGVYGKVLKSQCKEIPKE